MILPPGSDLPGELAGEMPYAAADLEPELTRLDCQELSESSSLPNDLWAGVDLVQTFDHGGVER